MSTSDLTRPIDLPLSERIPYPGVYQHIYLTRRKRPAHYRVRFIVPKRLYREGALPTPEGVEAYYGKHLRTVYLGCYKDPDVAFTASLMFLLNFVVEFPWTAPDVLCYLRSLDYSTPRIPFLDGITTAQDMQLFAHMEVFEMFPGTDESFVADLEDAVAPIPFTCAAVGDSVLSDELDVDWHLLEMIITPDDYVWGASIPA